MLKCGVGIMELYNLCTNCMNGSTERYICPSCGKPADWDTNRPVTALPSKYILGGQYYLGKVIGCGGFGITYLAWDINNKRRVAVKELYPNKDVTRDHNGCYVNVVLGQEDYVRHIKKRFLEEAQALYAFSSEPDIINVYRLFEENNTAYYAMEYLEGMDLKSALLKRGKMKWEQLSVYMSMVINSLKSIHGRGLIHRDISPDNIFLTTNGRAKLIDFGSLRSYNNPNGLTTILKHNFAPYEQYRTNGNQGPWTDIYALCVTMYYSLGGVLPPKAPDRIMSDKTVYIKQLCPDVPDNVASAIHKGMATMPENRYQNVVELSRDLFGTEEPRTYIGSAPGQPTGQSRFPHLEFVGSLNGKKWYMKPESSVVIGRDASCDIQFPPSTGGVSRRQCMVYVDENFKIWVKDENSSYGTFLDGQKIPSGNWVEASRGSVIAFGNEQIRILQ